MSESVDNKELHKHLKKLKIQLDSSNNLIETLKIKNAKLQMDLAIQNENYNKTVKTLNDEIIHLKSTSQLENYKSFIRTLDDKRKYISLQLKDIEIKNLIKEQLEVEFEYIQNLQSLLYVLFDNLYESSEGLCDISFEVQIILDKCYKSRNKISMYLERNDYILFFNKHKKEIDSILELLISKCVSLKSNFELSSYEKWILREKDYLYSCEKHSENYQRLIYLNSPSQNIKPFQLPDNLTEIHFTADMKHLIQHLLIISNKLNSILFKEDDCFLVLDCVTETSTTTNKISYFWTYDCYLQNTIRNLSKKLTPLFICEFRRFYKECFSHNNYIYNFQKLLNDRGIKRWKQYKFLYENIRILSDEYMFGEIIRNVIRKNCLYHSSGIRNDIIRGTAIGSVIKEYKEAQEYFTKGEPCIDEQEYFTEVFDDLREFNDNEFSTEYKQRWKDFLKVYYK